jgi:hypothetical protein
VWLNLKVSSEPHVSAPTIGRGRAQSLLRGKTTKSYYRSDKKNEKNNVKTS